VWGPWLARAYTGVDAVTSTHTQWVVIIPRVREVFETYGEALTFLLGELQWMAQDCDSEEIWSAWESARHWKPPSNPRDILTVTVGDPPGEYALKRVGYE
jgi:hypothetical protein